MPSSSEATTVFVICPFKEPFDSYYEKVYTPAIEAAGRRALRADDIFESGNVVSQTVESLSAAELVLAELSEPNANVYWELGVAHALGQPCVLLTQAATEIPFDLRNQRHLVYDVLQPDWATELRSDLCRALVETGKNPASSVLVPPSLRVFPREYGDSQGQQGPAVDVAPILSMLQASIDSLRADVFRGVSPMLHPSVSSSPGTSRELREEAQDLLMRGIPIAEVTAHLRGRGAPTIWARQVVADIAKEIGSGAT